MLSTRPRNDQERYCFTSEERHGIDERLQIALPAMVNQIGAFASQNDWTQTELQICVKLLETIKRTLSSAFVDITECAKQIIVLLGDNLHLSIDTFSILASEVHQVLSSAICGFVSGNRNVQFQNWLSTLVAKIQVEFVIASYWNLPRNELTLNDFTYWLHFLRIEQYCELLKIEYVHKTDPYEKQAVYSFHSQTGKWMTKTTVPVIDSMLTMRENIALYSLELLNDASITVTLFRPHRDDHSSKMAAMEIATLFHRFFPGPESDSYRTPPISWQKMNGLYRRLIAATHQNDLYAIIASQVPSMVGLNRSALFIHVPMSDAFKGIYGQSVHLDELRSVIESKERFLEICGSNFSKPVVMAAGEIVASNYIHTFGLGEMVVVPFAMQEEVAAVLIMDNHGQPFGCTMHQMDILCELKEMIEDVLYYRFSETIHPPVKKIQSQLTCREIEIIELMSRGLENKEIAHRLHISAYTVREHTSHILGKLGAANRTEAVAKAFRLGLVT